MQPTQQTIETRELANQSYPSREIIDALKELANSSTGSPNVTHGAMSPQTHLPALAEYLDLRDAQEKLKANFPTVDSLRWFIRRHRDRLADSGALILVAGRQKLHLLLTEEIVVDTGRRAALGEGRNER